MNRLFLIRHSITEGNERRLYYGKTDLPLTEAGRALCRSLRGSYSLPDGVAFASTGMLRTEETLQLLFGDVPHAVFPELRETDLGEFEMHSYDELKDIPAFRSWLSDIDGDTPIPGGESNRGFALRIAGALDRLTGECAGDLCVVCHGGTIARAMCICFPCSGKSFYDWIPKACHGYEIRFTSGKPTEYIPL